MKFLPSVCFVCQTVETLLKKKELQIGGSLTSHTDQISSDQQPATPTWAPWSWAVGQRTKLLHRAAEGWKRKDPHLHLPRTQKSTTTTTTGLLAGKSALEQPHLTSRQIHGFIKAINATWGKSLVVPQDKHSLYQPPGEKQGSVRTEHIFTPPMQISTSIQWESSLRSYFFKALKQLNLFWWKKKQ